MADINDIVLIHFENDPISFARIENIEPDIKKNWYHTTFLFLQNPPHITTWILKDEYINGVEFTMSGKKVRIEKVESPYKKKEKNPQKNVKKTQKDKSGKVLFLNNI
ncbi:MAG: hypothetical protein JRJ44_05985 [Deltaproteobacteria bacterium]|nr:hypothetical protein [Deltaproteobacteria bacterium]